MINKEASKNNNRPAFKDAPKEFKEELLRIDRVTRVTAGGRQLRFRASVVIGDGKGSVGLGLGKAGEVVVAIEKAIRDAKKNLIKVQIVGSTIAHSVDANFKAASVMLHPASEGTGIIAGGAMRKIIAISGIKDILAKRYGSNNPITNARATLKALSMIKKVTPAVKKEVEVIDTKIETVKETPIKQEVKKEEKTPVVKKATPAKKSPAKTTKK